jgi:hypothetical protein
MKHEKLSLLKNEQMVFYYQNNPVAAAKDLLHYDLIWLQRIQLREMWYKPFCMLVWGRGVGKTFMLALYATLKAMLFPDQKIGIFAPSMRQQGFVFDYVEQIIQSSEYAKMSCPRGVRRQPGEISAKFGSSVLQAYALGNDGGKARGPRYTTVLFDEYAQTKEDIVNLVVMPMLNIRLRGSRNQFICSSSAFWKWNHLYKLFCFYQMKQNTRPDLYSVTNFNYLDVVMTKDSPYQVDLDIIERQRANQPREEFEMENLALFPEETKGYFPSHLLYEASPQDGGESVVKIEPEHGDKNASYVVGIDAARVSDNFAIAVVRLAHGGQRKLVRLETMNNKRFQEMVYLIRTILKNYNVVMINNDSQGGGGTIKDMLGVPWEDYDEETGKPSTYLPIVDIDEYDPKSPSECLNILKQVNFTAKEKNNMFASFKAALQSKKFLFPLDVRRHEDRGVERIGREISMAKSELLRIRPEPLPSGTGIKFVTPSGYNDDRAVAVILANRAAEEVSKGERQDELAGQMATGLWASG